MYLSPRETEVLTALEAAAAAGLNKYEAGKTIKVNPYYTEIFLIQLVRQGLAAFGPNNKYFITDKGIARLKQAVLPGMNL